MIVKELVEIFSECWNEEAEEAAEELEGVFDVEVPVGPVVLAGVFEIFVGEVELVEVGVEFAVLFDEEVVGAAVDVEGGAEILGAGFGEVRGVVGTVVPVGAEDGLVFRELFVELLGAGFGFVEGGEERGRSGRRRRRRDGDV